MTLLDEDIAAADARKAAAAPVGAALASSAPDAAARPTVLLAPSWQEANILDSLRGRSAGAAYRAVVGGWWCARTPNTSSAIAPLGCAGRTLVDGDRGADLCLRV